jgi:hypothetical protein
VDEDDFLAQHRLRNAILEDESSSVTIVVNRDARNEVDVEIEAYLLRLPSLTAQDGLDPASFVFQAKISEADESVGGIFL